MRWALGLVPTCTRYFALSSRTLPTLRRFAHTEPLLLPCRSSLPPRSSQRDKLYQFSWRPRMPSLLPAEKEAEIAKNLKQYTKRYDEEDEQLLQQADADVLQERQRALDEWKAYCESRRNYAALQMDFKRELYGPRFAEKEYTIQKVMVEQVVDQKEEPYSTK